MARPLRLEFPGAIYHVTSRMVGGAKDPSCALFCDGADYERYTERLAERIATFDIRLYLFCLMRNHVHLVIETPEGNLSRFMQSLSTAYTVYYNLRHDRHGHLMDGRFKAKLVEGDEYLLALSRYVHLNPVRGERWEPKPVAERIQFVRQYRWSSYPGYLSRRNAFDFVTDGPVLSQLTTDTKRQRGRYRRFVEAGLATNDEEFEQAMEASRLSLGSDTYRQKIDELYQDLLGSRLRPEDVAFRRVTEPLSPDAVLRVVAEMMGEEEKAFRQRRRDSPLRAVACRMLMRFAGLSQRDVADYLAMGNGSGVSWHLRRLRVREETDRQLAKRVDGIRARLSEVRQGS